MSSLEVGLILHWLLRASYAIRRLTKDYSPSIKIALAKAGQASMKDASLHQKSAIHYSGGMASAIREAT
jgi:hypothetical protein